MKTIYLAVVQYDYEGYDVMRAFTEEADANAFVELCKKHNGEKPSYPSRNDPSWDAACAARRAWDAAEPEHFKGGDGYEVMSVTLD